ncbi:N-acetylmuramoyl-L-alanine amidase [Deinococcus sedimenti]|uniref:MurNAc-LAA domain-containing protein n=1 Tax=Deinococcus sedimenti TaxID=1867090 RepID=A0ABQ2S5W1_9DEIO|nr:N-acetylmuramoyl-L-alanine amidase [Deinococcus sedimenti]GGR88930.1 hypothetical protein GCM10008960_14960 [Deinococcus sedimenti]
MRWRAPAGRRTALAAAAGSLLLIGLASAQIAFSRLNLAGREVQSIQLYGAEYASESNLSSLLSISEDSGVIRVTGLGHILLLPLDEDQQRATTSFNTVQLDTRRVQGRTATRVNGNLYLPLDTLASGLGAQYEQGKFTLAAPKLVSVSSRAGRDTDRVVLDLSRDVQVTDEQRGDRVILTLKGLQGDARRYTTRGAFVPSAEVARSGADLTVTLPLPASSGYRVFKVVRGSGIRIVVDAGPGVPSSAPELLARINAPLIILDPAVVPGVSSDVTLEVARQAAQLLTEKGWQVRVTRSSGANLNREEVLTLARQSDVYLALDLGRLPGAKRSGVTVYEQTGRASSQLINSLRGGSSAPYSALIVAGAGSTRRLGELLRGELKGGGVTAGQQTISRVQSLGEAPQAALLLELGWANNAQDLATLSSAARQKILSVAVARSVATYLTARANNNANVSVPGVTP